MNPLAILEQEGSTWRAYEVDEYQLLQKLEKSNASVVIIAESLSFLSSPRLQNDFSTKYHVPGYFWTENFQRSNGFLGWESWNKQIPSLQYNMCFRFLVKQLGHDLGTIDKDYVWYEMGFFCHWTASGKMVLLCLDIPLLLRDHFQRAVMSSQTPVMTDMGWLSSVLLSQIVHLYDRSVWTLRDRVRGIEKSRNEGIHDQPSFVFLHDVARHVIHSTETLDVAVNTIDRIIEMAGLLGMTAPAAGHSIQQDLAFHKQVLQNLQARSQALDARLRNEINLAFNLVALRDSRTNVQIGIAAQRDSAAMHTISLVTMAFLPATFVSTIFSMSFFSFSASNPSDRQSWVVSDRIWIYWVFAGPLTLATLMLWFLRERGWKSVLKTLRHRYLR